MTSLHDAQIWSDSSQSHRHCSTYSPGLVPFGMRTESTTSRFGSSGDPAPLDHPEQRQVLRGPVAYPPYALKFDRPLMHASDSWQTGS